MTWRFCSSPPPIERELRPRDGGAAQLALTGFGIAQIHEPVVREVGMQHDVAQAALTEPADLGHTANIDGRAAWRVELQHSPLLGDEHATVRKKGDGPRDIEVRDLRHRERQVLGEYPARRPGANGGRKREQMVASWHGAVSRKELWLQDSIARLQP